MNLLHVRMGGLGNGDPRPTLKKYLHEPGVSIDADFEYLVEAPNETLVLIKKELREAKADYYVVKDNVAVWNEEIE